ncbi:MAG TPA: DUF5047 domain-containing protein [Nocardioidaceae bacterium]|nr:DUF5047 domain-containing protein [Nocardioidaceae bacterium]
MITVSDRARAILEDGTFTYHVRAESWLGADQLAEDIPIAAGEEDTDRTLNVPERVTLTVPRRDRGVSWEPATATDPLAAEGQIIKISLGVQTGLGAIEWFQRGEFPIITTRPDDQGALQVTCAGLLYLVQEAGFVSPFQPSGTIGSTLRALTEPALPVDVTDAPADRSVPSAINWDDRLGAVNELLDAWPAQARTNELGFLEVTADTVPAAALRSFTDGAGGTVITVSGNSTREGGFNVVVATGQAADGGELRSTAEVTSGPWQYGVGPANPLPVPFGYASPLLTTQAQCSAAARTVLRRKMRQAVLRRYAVRCVPDPTIQHGDPVEITSADLGLDALLCTVESLVLPYQPGEMTMTVVSTT